MRNYLAKYLSLVALFSLTATLTNAQKGSLFIIGGGNRSTELMKELVTTAALSPKDYIVVLPMATSVPVESVASVSKDLSALCNNAITSFNFTKAQANDNKAWIDSVKNARLIYITGGDQNKFMAVVKGSALYTALHEAYNNGATISGTSAGAAVMSEIMITGGEKNKAEGDFKEITKDNAITSQGMGFLTTAIIDQHFIKRSRYNRLLSVLADHPDKTLIGIDEETAIIVKGKKIKVAGNSQVIIVSQPKKLNTWNNNKVSFNKASLSILTPGSEFQLK